MENKIISSSWVYLSVSVVIDLVVLLANVHTMTLFLKKDKIPIVK